MHDHAAQRDLLSLQAVPQRPTVRGLVRQRVHPLMVGEQSLVPNAVEAAWRHLQERAPDELIRRERHLSSCQAGFRGVLEVLRHEPFEVGLRGDRGMFHRVARPRAGWQAGDLEFWIRMHEQRNGITVTAGAIADAMRCRQKASVRPAREHVAGIEQDGTRNGRREKPFTRAPQQLEPWHARGG